MPGSDSSLWRRWNMSSSSCCCWVEGALYDLEGKGMPFSLPESKTEKPWAGTDVGGFIKDFFSGDAFLEGDRLGALWKGDGILQPEWGEFMLLLVPVMSARMPVVVTLEALTKQIDVLWVGDGDRRTPALVVEEGRVHPHSQALVR
jgi:hypothetical protein